MSGAQAFFGGIVEASREVGAVAGKAPGARVGVFGVGLAVLAGSFEGLRERLEDYQRGGGGAPGPSLGRRSSPPGLADTAPAAPCCRSTCLPDLVSPFSFATSALTPRARRCCRRCSRHPAGAPSRRCWCSTSSRRPHSTTPTPTRASGWPTARPAACPKSPYAFARAGIRFQVVSGVLDPTIRTPTPAPGVAEIGDWCPRRAVRRRGAAPGAHRLSRPHLPRHARPLRRPDPVCRRRLGAHVESWRWTIWTRVAAAARDARSRPRSRAARATFSISTGRRGRGRWSGRRGWPRAWTGWWRDFDLQGLTYYYRGLDGNEFERFGAVAHCRQFAADRARGALRRRGRPPRRAWPCC